MVALFEHWTAQSPQTPRDAEILAHPDTDSFNAAVAPTCCKWTMGVGYSAILRNLDRIEFDSKVKTSGKTRAGRFVTASDVAAKLAIIERAKVFVLVYPIWFGTSAPLLVGCIDRGLGQAFGCGEIRTRHRFMGGKRPLSITTSGNRSEGSMNRRHGFCSAPGSASTPPNPLRWRAATACISPASATTWPTSTSNRNSIKSLRWLARFARAAIPRTNTIIRSVNS